MDTIAFFLRFTLNLEQEKHTIIYNSNLSQQFRDS
jgi:hypothetical protein